MEPIQIIILLFALFSLSRVILRYKDDKVTNGELILWIVIWVSIIVVAIVPGIISWFSQIFGVGRPIDLITYVSIILLFYLIFRIYVKVHSLDQDITKIVRKIAKNEKKK